MIKKYRHLLTLLICIICSPPIHGSITKLNNINDLKVHLKDLNEHDLVIFDIDDVVIQPVDQIFHPKNKDELKKHITDLYNKKSNEQMNDLLSTINIQQQVKLVDPSINTIFASLEKRSIPTVALTQCGTGKFGKINDITEWRIEQLNNLKINFKALNPYKNAIYNNLRGKHGIAMFKSGVIFTGHLDKGEVLKEFLKANKLSPKTIVFIDDKISNLQSVEQALAGQNITFLGFEYLAVTNQKVHALDKESVYFQFSVLEKDLKWIPDVNQNNKKLIEDFNKEYNKSELSNTNYNDEFINNKKKVKQVLLKMDQADQKIRTVWENIAQNCHKDKLDCTNDFHQADIRMMEVDAINQDILKRFMKKYPWFKISEFGKDGAQAAWVIMQHTDDNALQAKVLFIMGNLLSSDEADKQSYALLYDRLSLDFKEFGIKQRYGSQFALSDDRKKMIFQPCDGELDQIEARRKEIGLKPLKENAKILADILAIKEIEGLDLQL